MFLPNIEIKSSFAEINQVTRLGCLLHQVVVSSSDHFLQSQIAARLKAIETELTIEAIHDIQPLKETRKAYKSLGKDPSRYRPSAEALMRRIAQGKGLYRVNNVVDCLNLISVQSGFSIGGYDAGKIVGNIILGRGAADEPYNAIGRGELNMEGLPLLRDELGAFGSPTSDSERTMVTENTTHFLSVFFSFGKSGGLEQAMDHFCELLKTHCSGKLHKRMFISA